MTPDHPAHHPGDEGEKMTVTYWVVAASHDLVHRTWEVLHHVWGVIYVRQVTEKRRNVSGHKFVIF